MDARRKGFAKGDIGLLKECTGRPLRVHFPARLT